LPLIWFWLKQKKVGSARSVLLLRGRESERVGGFIGGVKLRLEKRKEEGSHAAAAIE
jgi:hypothetical protein